MRKDANRVESGNELGTPNAVASLAAREFRQMRFCGRHPILSFIVLPIISLPLLWTVSLIVMLVSMQLLGFESGNEPNTTLRDWAEWSLPTVTLATVLVPIVIATIVFCALARRAAVGWKWTLAAASLLAALGSLAVFQFVLPKADHSGSLSVGLGVSTHPSWAQISQFLVPLAIAAWTILRRPGHSQGPMTQLPMGQLPAAGLQ